MARLCFVEAIIGGVQKSGTTSLFSYMSEHSQLAGPIRKEAHFFDDETLNWANPDYSLYHRFFAQSETVRFSFESTPVYLFWPPALARIRDYNPAMRLIFLFRDPIERAWSHWCMEYARSAEELPFAAAIRHGRWRLRGIGPLQSQSRVYSYVERGFYGQQVRRALSFFPRDQLLFLRSVDLLGNLDATMLQITEFLGIDAFPPLRPRIERPRPKFDYPSTLTAADVAYLAEIFLPEVTDFAALTGLRVDDWLTVRAGHGG